ncbi:recombinase family protein [Streptomyces albidoflavus]
MHLSPAGTRRDDGGPLRILAALRISLDDDASTSIERQQEELKEWLHHNPWAQLVHATEDRSVSGAIDLKDRPGLGPWLREEDKQQQWDALWVSTQDRLGRDDLHFMAFVKDVMDWKKVIFVGDDPSFDLTTETGRLIAYAKATQAAGELRKIRERARKSRDYLRRHGMWAGGNLPFGYQPVAIQVGHKIHYKLVQETTYAKLFREIVRRVLEGEPLRKIAADLNERKILTWRDYEGTLPPLPGAKKKQREPKGIQWHPSAISRLFKKRSCVGQLEYTDKETGKVRVAELEDGDPVMFTDEPLITEAERTQVLAKIGERASKPHRARQDVSRGSGVSTCGNCGQGATINRVTHTLKSGPKTYERYRCSSSTKARQCSEPGYIEKSTLDEFVDRVLLLHLGDREEVKMVKTKGEDHTAELEGYRRRLTVIEREDEQGFYDDDRESYFKKRRNMVSRIKELETKPVIPDSVEYVPTGRTFRQKWEGMTTEEQREYLIEHNVLIGFWRSGRDPKERAAYIWIGDLAKVAAAMGVPGDELPPGGLHTLNMTSQQTDAALAAIVKHPGANAQTVYEHWEAERDRQIDEMYAHLDSE